MAEELATSIEEMSCTNQLKGYNRNDVETFLAGLAQRLREGVPVTAKEIAEVEFRQQLKGCNVVDVDAFLAWIAQRLQAGPASPRQRSCWCSSMPLPQGSLINACERPALVGTGSDT